jgi:anion-transporting  ArsA/GET3 family ATPase
VRRWADLGSIRRAVVTVPLASHASAASLAPLLQKRVLFFVGKGGVGKTTVAAAFSLAAAQQGKKTLLIEIGDHSRAARLFNVSPSQHEENTPWEISPALSMLFTSGAAALEEYLALIIPVKRLMRLLVESRPYQYFVAAAPGLKELLTIGKIWYEERRRDAVTQQPRWDLLVVDLPATGHGLQYLNMPCAARDTFSEGVVHREAERITAWLRDADKIAINLVATAEELPVSETVEAYQQLTDKLQLPLGALFVNRVREAPLSAAMLAQWKPAPAQASPADLSIAEQMLAYAVNEATWTEAQDIYLRQLSRLPLPLVKLPLCFSREFGAAQLAALAQRLTHHTRQGRKRTRTSG